MQTLHVTDDASIECSIESVPLDADDASIECSIESVPLDADDASSECSIESVPFDENIVIPHHVDSSSSIKSMVNTAVNDRLKLLELDLAKHIGTVSLEVQIQIDDLTHKVNGLEQRLQAMQESHPTRSASEEATQRPNSVCTRQRRAAGRSISRLASNLKIHEWTLSPSSWEAPILIGHPYFGVGTSITVLIMLFINLVMQSVFIYIVAEHLTTITFTQEDIDGFHYFRTYVAHHVKDLDLNTELTLAKRVCDKDLSLHVGDKQLEAVQLVDEYGSIGSVMCLAASLCWIFTVLPEFQSCAHFVEALTALSTGQVLDNAADGDGVEFVLGRVRFRRHCLLGFLVVVRIVIAGLLLMWGLKYLAYTVSLPDLILNAVALELVLCIDEITFAALAPVRMQIFVQNMMPLRIRDMQPLRGIDWQSVTAFFFAMGSLIVSAMMWIYPQTRQLTIAKTELCQGRKDILFAGTQDGFLVWADADISERTQLFTTTKYNVLRQLIHTPRSKYHTVNATGLTDNLLNFWAQGASKGRASVLEQEAWTQAHFLNSYNYFCQDIGNNRLFGQRFLAGIRDIMDDQSVTECADVKEHCGRETFEGRIVRQACPEICGCNSLESDLVPNGLLSGCPPGCVNHAQRQKDESQRTCTDIEPGGLDAYAQGYRTFYDDFQGMEGLVYLIHESVKLFEEHGCDGHKRAIEFGNSVGVTDWDFCVADTWPTGVKSLKWYCPQTCNCTKGVNECPTSCPYARV